MMSAVATNSKIYIQICRGQHDDSYIQAVTQTDRYWLMMVGCHWSTIDTYLTSIQRSIASFTINDNFQNIIFFC